MPQIKMDSQTEEKAITESVSFTNNNKSRIVLLGANGFVGKALRERCESEQQSLHAVSSKDIDLTQPDSGKKLAAILQPQDVLIFASAITPDKSKDVTTFTKNIAMASTVVDALRCSPVSKVVYISSDAVFAEDLPPISEATCPCPNTLYGIMHYAREKMLEQTCMELSIPLAILRPCSIYGMGDTHNSYGPNRFVNNAMNEGVIRLFGEGEETRPHLYIEDLVDLLLNFSRSDQAGVFHPIPSESLSFREVADIVVSAARNDVRIEKLARASQPTHKRFDSTRLFDAVPQFQFRDLRQAIAQLLQ